jgi:hypothetical protein
MAKPATMEHDAILRALCAAARHAMSGALFDRFATLAQG